MPKITISVTDAARNFSECVNRARYQDATFVLLKNGSPVARLAPADANKCSGRSLAEALAQIKLPDEEARLWQHALKTGRKSLKTTHR